MDIERRLFPQPSQINCTEKWTKRFNIHTIAGAYIRLEQRSKPHFKWTVSDGFGAGCSICRMIFGCISNAHIIRIRIIGYLFHHHFLTGIADKIHFGQWVQVHVGITHILFTEQFCLLQYSIQFGTMMSFLPEIKTHTKMYGVSSGRGSRKIVWCLPFYPRLTNKLSAHTKTNTERSAFWSKKVTQIVWIINWLKRN